MSNTDMKNVGAAATAPDAKIVFEAVQLPPEYSPIWAGAPAIIRRHFCGVAA